MPSFRTNNTDIVFAKIKFFFFRVIVYFSFLLLPVWIQKSLGLGLFLQSFIMALYIVFIVCQWFLLGKEIDYRLKIYFRVNSSMDRVVYRLLLGMCFFIIYFNIISFFPPKWVYNLFWTTWIVLGLFYSWPTRGKIIEESLASNFNESSHLDSFEKTLLVLISIIFITSIPQLPTLTDKEALKIFFDNTKDVNSQIWNFLTVNYYPFYRYPSLLKIAWSMHFYFVGVGLFLLTFYTFLRFFISRRLSLLGVFALLSSWSFSKILTFEYGASLVTTYSLIWIWSTLWVTKSSTYRAGLFLGLINYYGTLINPINGFFVIPQLFLLYFSFLKEKTIWFKKQLLKYSIPGLLLTFFVLLTHWENLESAHTLSFSSYLKEAMVIIERKSFNILAILGVIILLAKYFLPQWKIFRDFQFDTNKMTQVIVLLLIPILCSLVFGHETLRGFFVMWPVILLALLPLEILFQKISRLRSSRNMIYLIYILICLLDSHFEERVKIFMQFFTSS